MTAVSLPWKTGGAVRIWRPLALLLAFGGIAIPLSLARMFSGSLESLLIVYLAELAFVYAGCNRFVLTAPKRITSQILEENLWDQLWFGVRAGAFLVAFGVTIALVLVAYWSFSGSPIPAGFPAAVLSVAGLMAFAALIMLNGVLSGATAVMGWYSLKGRIEPGSTSPELAISSHPPKG